MPTYTTIELHPDPDAQQLVFVDWDKGWRETARPVLNMVFADQVGITVSPGLVMIGQHDLAFVDLLAEVSAEFRAEVHRLAAGQSAKVPVAGPTRRLRRRAAVS